MIRVEKLLTAPLWLAAGILGVSLALGLGLVWFGRRGLGLVLEALAALHGVRADG
jgi:hypothetical protein